MALDPLTICRIGSDSLPDVGEFSFKVCQELDAPMTVSPDTADKVVRALARAAEANRETPCRHGNTVELSQDVAQEVMITADLHGNRLNFDRLLKIADLEHHPRRHLIMQEVCHGGPTYPKSGGCMSHLLLEDIAQLKVRYPDRVHFLIGNHELAEMADFPIAKSNRMLNLAFRCGIQELYGDASDRVRTAYLEFLRSCPLVARIEKRVFVSHSAPENLLGEPFDPTIFERPLTRSDLHPHSSVFRLLWGRDFGEENAGYFARLVDADVLIHGHEPCPSGYQVPNSYQVILDCCASPIAYALLPTGKTWTVSDVVRQIVRIA